MSLYKPSLQDLIDRIRDLTRESGYVRYEYNFVNDDGDDIDLRDIDDYHDDEIDYVTITAITSNAPDETTCYRNNNDGRFEVVVGERKYHAHEYFGSYK